MLRRWLALTLFAVLVVLAAPRAARADQPGAHTVPVAVLGFDSEDAEEQADAITGALRSRVRSAQGWSLTETTATIGMLTAALKCPARPTADCQQRIGEQIKSERYIWGVVSKGPSPGQVTAEVHLYQRGKSDTVIKESFADNLKDPQDDKGIGKIAARVIERLGTQLVGAVVVKAGEGPTEIVVDGEKHVPLANGTARVELAAGGHAVEVTAGSATIKRNVLVAAGKEAVVDLTANAQPVAAGAEPEKTPFPTRKVLGGVSLAAGVALGVVSVLNVTAWLDDKSQGEEVAKTVPNGLKPCEQQQQYGRFCDLDKSAKTHSAIAWVTGTVGVVALGAGAYLFFVDGGASEKTASAAANKTRVVPTVGGGTTGVMVTGAF